MKTPTTLAKINTALQESLLVTVDLLIERLRGHLPKRTWEAAMRAAREAGAEE